MAAEAVEDHGNDFDRRVLRQRIKLDHTRLLRHEALEPLGRSLDAVRRFAQVSVDCLDLSMRAAGFRVRDDGEGPRGNGLARRVGDRHVRLRPGRQLADDHGQRRRHPQDRVHLRTS